jgi:hypothetical protein
VRSYRTRATDLGIAYFLKSPWFDLGGGVPAQPKRLMIESGETVIYAILGTDDDRQRLRPKPR